jgi:hypothetical protein
MPATAATPTASIAIQGNFMATSGIPIERRPENIGTTGAGQSRSAAPGSTCRPGMSRPTRVEAYWLTD